MKKQQSGMALLFVLVILLVVVMVGVSAMRGSLFHETMAFNSQAEDLTFQAAESAISSVLRHASTAEQGGDASQMLGKMVSGSTVDGCATLSQGFVAVGCSDAATDTLDARTSILASSTSSFQLQANAKGFDPDIVLDYEFQTQGVGSFTTASNLPFSNTNVQNWRKLGAASGYFEDRSDLMGDDVGNEQGIE